MLSLPRRAIRVPEQEQEQETGRSAQEARRISASVRQDKTRGEGSTYARISVRGEARQGGVCVRLNLRRTQRRDGVIARIAVMPRRDATESLRLRRNLLRGQDKRRTSLEINLATRCAGGCGFGRGAQGGNTDRPLWPLWVRMGPGAGASIANVTDTAAGPVADADTDSNARFEMRGATNLKEERRDGATRRGGARCWDVETFLRSGRRSAAVTQACAYSHAAAASSSAPRLSDAASTRT